jgi:hypothetical protein
MSEQSKRTNNNTAQKIAAGVAIGAVLGTGLGLQLRESTNDYENAAKISAEAISTHLYDKTNYPKGVLVPGVLNAEVVVKDKAGTITWNNPVLLEQANEDNLAGAWLGLPSHDAKGRVILQPVQLHPGTQDGVTETVVPIGPNGPLLLRSSVKQCNGEPCLMPTRR